MKSSLTIEWRERGKWVRSVNVFDNKAQAEEHADIIGAKVFRVIKVKRKAKKKA
jgi:hypothetical protein